MNISIYFPTVKNEFFDDLSLEDRIQKYLFRHCPFLYTISSLAPIYLVGGGIRDLILATVPKDLDFVVLGSEHLNLLWQLFECYQINPTLNHLGGYKFRYQDTTIDIWCTEDLFSAMQYNGDGLFFSLSSNTLISFTFDDFLKNGLKLVNSSNNISNGREKKLIKFLDEYLKMTKK